MFGIEQLVTDEGIDAAAKATQGRMSYEDAEELVLAIIRLLDDHQQQEEVTIDGG